MAVDDQFIKTPDEEKLKLIRLLSQCIDKLAAQSVDDAGFWQLKQALLQAIETYYRSRMLHPS